MDETVETRVARGAAWLDSVHPGWERRIDLASLDLASSCRCVIGQLFGDFDDFTFEVVLPAVNDLLISRAFSSEHGFSLPFDLRSPAAWRALDDAWTSLIKERFASGLLSDEVAS